MARVLQLKGIEKVVANMKDGRSQVINAISRGLKRGGLHLQRESQKIVPVDAGVLRGSAFTRKQGSGEDTDVVVGYTAAYAVYVHEDLEAKHGREFNEAYGGIYRRKGSRVSKETGQKYSVTTKYKRTPTGKNRLRGEEQQAKFLEKPAREKRGEILQIVFQESGHPGAI